MEMALHSDVYHTITVLDAWMWARRPKGEAEIGESTRWREGYERTQNNVGNGMW
jgi:hypothetical protein